MSDVGANRRVAGLAIESAAPRAWRATLAVIAYGLPVAFILLPLLAFLAYSFFSVAGVTMSYAPTLANYQRFFTDPVFLPVFWRTCLLCLEVAVLAVRLRLSRRLLSGRAGGAQEIHPAAPAAWCRC